MIKKDIEDILSKISWKPSNVNMGWQWEVEQVPNGHLIRTTFLRPDTHSGKLGRGYGRWMHIPWDASEDAVVKTAWLCAELIVRHELMESFTYKEVRVFDPHKTINELSYYEQSN